jgi:transglutaminase-like putative cysteine protease
MSKIKLSFLGILFSLLITIYYFLSPRIALAENQFAVDATVTYKVEESGKTLVTHDIVLENLFSTVYATTYTLSLENISAENIKAVSSEGKVIQIETNKNDTTLSAKVLFPDPVVGKGARRHFKIFYENSNFAIKTGEVWEISIPKLADSSSFNDYKISLEVPTGFGQEAYISPRPSSFNFYKDYNYYTFGKDLISQSGVTAGFGQFQVFNFNLSYHLENPLSVNSRTGVAIPPDTAFQKVYISSLVPKPDSMDIDEDGNWIATYKLSPRQRIDVNAVGSVQIFAGYRPFPKPSNVALKDSLTPTTYWQSTDPKIQELARTLKTPEAIYDYISKNLKYDFDRVQPNVQRTGAINALANPTQSICMEFTDLFIAIARAAGIPAREVNGYAYTENKELQPLSLVADVLHAWPEYYDKNKGVWIPIDPTWGSTSGVDYFNKLDLRHFAFVIHGKNDREPYAPGSYKLGPNPQKDVYVSFGQLPHDRNSIPQIKLTTNRNLPFLDSVYTFSVYNPGPASIYSFYPIVYFDGKEKSRTLVGILPPFSTYKSQIVVPFSLLGKDTPDKIKVSANESQMEISTNKSQIVINSLIVLFVIFIFIIILVMAKLGRINFSGIAVTISQVYGKITRRTSKNQNNP